MFAILIQETTLELITAMNDGVTPEIEIDKETGEPDTFFVYFDHETTAEIISSQMLRNFLDTDQAWEPLKFAIWRK